MRVNYPDTWRYIKAQRARHPRDDAMEEDMSIGTMSKPDWLRDSNNPLPGCEVKKMRPRSERREETKEEYVARRCEAWMHKNLSSRRGAGGKLFVIGGGGEGGVAYQVV